MDKRISRDSTEALRVEVLATSPAGAAVDPTGYAVSVAVLPVSTVDPLPTDFQTATWAQGPRSKVALVMVGPDTAVGTLSPGRYGVWVKVTASPEAPVMRSDSTLIVY